MPDPQCRIHVVDGQPVTVRSEKPIPHEAVTEVTRAVQRHMLADAIQRGPGDEAIRLGRYLYGQHRIRAIRARAR